MSDRESLKKDLDDKKQRLVKLQTSLDTQRHYNEIDKKKQEEREKNFIEYPKMIEKCKEEIESLEKRLD